MARRGKAGGQAVLEGVMMKSKTRYAIAVRREDGSIVTQMRPNQTVRDKYKILRLPIIRGVVNFVETLILSFQTLTYSAEAYGLEEEEPGKFEKWLNRKFGKSLADLAMVIGGVLGVALAVGLFILLPSFLSNLIFGALGVEGTVWRSLVAGIIKIGIFVLYIWAVSLMRDIRRTYEYHGAEHKTIFCYEAGDDLTVENVKKYRRFHPRCGTSFIFVMLIISILIYALPFIPWDNMLLHALMKILLLPLIIGIGFEFLMYAGKHDNVLVRILSAPGLWMQRLTTREPDASQIEVAIRAFKLSLYEEFPGTLEEYEAQKAKEAAETASAKEAPDASVKSDEGNAPSDKPE